MLSDALLKIGEVVKTRIPVGIPRCAETPLETLRRLAATSCAIGLKSPPPAILHPSKNGSDCFLYGANSPSSHADAPYREGNWLPPEGIVCVGGMMIEISKFATLPCLLLAAADGATLHLFVPNAPLGACEAELFSGISSAFETAWMGDALESTLDIRKQVGKHIRSCGLHCLPKWLLAGNFHLCRPGTNRCLEPPHFCTNLARAPALI
jgi:hypothetical protein